MKNIVKLFKSEEGQGMVEYGLIIALVAVVAIIGLSLLGPKIRDMFSNIATQLDPATSAKPAPLPTT